LHRFVVVVVAMSDASTQNMQIRKGEGDGRERERAGNEANFQAQRVLLQLNYDLPSTKKRA